MGLYVGGLVVAIGVVMLIGGMTHSGTSLFQVFTGKKAAGSDKAQPSTQATLVSFTAQPSATPALSVGPAL